MNEFYYAIEQYLDNARNCSKCNEKMFICYQEGHIDEKCFNCPEELDLNPAKYITTYDVPDVPPPDNFEIRDYIFGSHVKEHEKAYRKINSIKNKEELERLTNEKNIPH